jgi:hypothetical protein
MASITHRGAVVEAHQKAYNTINIKLKYSYYTFVPCFRVTKRLKPKAFFKGYSMITGIGFSHGKHILLALEKNVIHRMTYACESQ